MNSWQLVENAPSGRWLITWREGEHHWSISMLAYGGDNEWCALDGRTTVTHSTYLPPTHWYEPPAFPEATSVIGCVVGNIAHNIVRRWEESEFDGLPFAPPCREALVSGIDDALSRLTADLATALDKVQFWSGRDERQCQIIQETKAALATETAAREAAEATLAQAQGGNRILADDRNKWRSCAEIAEAERDRAQARAAVALDRLTNKLEAAEAALASAEAALRAVQQSGRVSGASALWDTIDAALRPRPTRKK